MMERMRRRRISFMGSGCADAVEAQEKAFAAGGGERELASVA